MKLSSTLFVIMFIIIIFTSWILLVEDFETYYIDNGISSQDPLNESYKDTFMDSDEINDTFYDLQQDFESMQNDDEDSGGFLSNLFSVGLAVPKAIIDFMIAILKLFDSVGTGLANLFQLIGIPIIIGSIVMISVAVYVIIQLVNLWRRDNV